MNHPCGDDCWHEPDYVWCRPCGEHHRPPECAIDSEGRPLDPSGEPWLPTQALREV